MLLFLDVFLLSLLLGDLVVLFLVEGFLRVFVFLSQQVADVGLVGDEQLAALRAVLHLHLVVELLIPLPAWNTSL